MTPIHLTLVLVVFLAVFCAAAVIATWGMFGRPGAGAKRAQNAKIKAILAGHESRRR